MLKINPILYNFNNYKLFSFKACNNQTSIESGFVPDEYDDLFVLQYPNSKKHLSGYNNYINKKTASQFDIFENNKLDNGVPVLGEELSDPDDI